MFDATVDYIEPNRITRYTITRDGAPLTYSDVLTLWRTNAEFRSYFTQLLFGSPFSAYRWETPSITRTTVNRTFQFVLLNCPGFCSRTTDHTTYRNYFTTDDAVCGVVSFSNLGGDATLVVPSPRTTADAYGHLAAFIRSAPKSQLDAFWQVLSKEISSHLSENPLWISTAGGGVAWLHIRLDSTPKYYGYAPYKVA